MPGCGALWLRRRTRSAHFVWTEKPFVGVIALATLSRGVDELENTARTLGASPVSLVFQ